MPGHYCKKVLLVLVSILGLKMQRPRCVSTSRPKVTQKYSVTNLQASKKSGAIGVFLHNLLLFIHYANHGKNGEAINSRANQCDFHNSLTRASRPQPVR